MRLLEVPFYKQDTNYTCGPAAMQMVLSYHDIAVSEADLAKRLKTEPDNGTRRVHMREVAQFYDLSCYVNDEATFEEFEFLISLNAPVIVRFIETDNDDDHYGVVIGADHTTLVIHDPWNGPALRFSKQDFLPRWTCDEIGNCDKWLMAVSKEPLPLGRQFT